MKTIRLILFNIIISIPTFAQFTCGDTLVDFRDGNKYPTIQIGSQCWMGANLNIGTMVMALTNANVQINNSLIEKFCYNNDSLNCDSLGGLYQWDEMMNYTNLEGIQGICPNGWHIPSEAEWDTLFDQFNPLTVAIDLQTGGSSGFNAPAAGYCYHNYTNWVFGSIGTYGAYRTSALQTIMGNNYSTIYFYYPSVGTISSGSFYEKSSAYSVRCIWNGSSTGLIINKNNKLEISDPYPNPAQDNFTINFQMPKSEQAGEIVFFNTNGKVVEKIKIKRGMTSVKVTKFDFNDGVYFYYLLTKSSNSIVKKLEIIK